MISKDQIISKTINYFIEYFDSEPEFTCAYPGRINLIGEHLDYNRGMSISCGINRWVSVSISNRKDNKIVVRSENLKSEFIFTTDLEDNTKELWHKYVFGSLSIFACRHQLKKGLNIIMEAQQDAVQQRQPGHQGGENGQHSSIFSQGLHQAP